MIRPLISLALVLGLVGASLGAQSRVLLPRPLELHLLGPQLNSAGAAADAAGEYSGIVGQVFLPAGASSKTCSSAGCAIHWDTQSVAAFANAGTAYRIGLQDVDTATGLPDGTYDVHAELVGGTDTIPGSGTLRTPMESGTKTVNAGDILVVLNTMVSRGGSDSVTPDRQEMQPQGHATYGFPYGVQNTGTPTKVANVTRIVIEFDDGTFGWIDRAPSLVQDQAAHTDLTFHSGSATDEVAVVFSLNMECAVSGFSWYLGDVETGDTFELILYSDPLGTPAVEVAVAMDPDLGITSVARGHYQALLTTREVLLPNTLYGMAVRPTTTGSITVRYETMTSTSATANRAGYPFVSFGLYGRADQSGAFASLASGLAVPHVALWIAELVQ